MSYMKQLAIEQMEKEAQERDYQEIKDSDAFKLGYCRSAIGNAVWLLELGRPENALRCLKDCQEMMKDKGRDLHGI